MKSTQLLHSLFLLLSLGSHATGTISYTYDLAGNRISRIYTADQPVHLQAKKQEETITPPIEEEKVGERTIRIYPNPTKGALGVEILGGKENEQIRIQLYNLKGTQLISQPMYSGLNTVNMFDCAVGMYILRLVSEKETIEYKVVKE